MLQRMRLADPDRNDSARSAPASLTKTRLCIALVCVQGIWAAPGLAQTVEYLPENAPIAVVEAEPVADSASDTPTDAEPATVSDESFGVDLLGIVLLGPRDPVATFAPRPVDAARLPERVAMHVTTSLEGLIGQPLSPALIAATEAAVVAGYRAAGFPFVAVSTPPQEITTGVLNLRVVEFAAGRIEVRGAARISPERLRGGLRQAEGAPIDAQVLAQDLDWLNRNPFRSVRTDFAPGDALGEAVVTLNVAETRQWSFSAGYFNTGSAATGRDRLSLGVSMGDLGLPGTVLAYRATLSPEEAESGTRAFTGQALQASVPFAARAELSLTVSLSETAETQDVFEITRRTEDIALTWSGALSNMVDLPGDLRFGLEQRVQSRDTFFGPIPVLEGRIAVRQMTLGWSHRWSGERGGTGIDLTLRFSPGDLGADNADGDFEAFSFSRVSDARYAYLTFRLDRQIPIGGFGHGVDIALTGQVGSGPLPETERFGLGGAAAVRGYAGDEAAVDHGLTLRNAYRFAPVQTEVLQYRPFVFADLGIGAADGDAELTSLASVGAGVVVAAWRAAEAEVSLAQTLRDGPLTDGGETRFDFNLVYRF